MRMAIIDMGTNTFNVLVRDPGNPEFEFSDKIPVRLGEGGFGTGRLSEAAVERAQGALSSLMEMAKNQGAVRIEALATSAIRDASNGGELVDWAQRTLGLHIEVIDGIREAQYILEGVRHALDLPADPVLVVDIGGGSTEVLVAKGAETLWMKSFPLGVSRLKELFCPSDPLSIDDQARLHEHCAMHFKGLKDELRQYQPRWLIGSSGSFDTLADLVRVPPGTPEVWSPSEPIAYDAALSMCALLQQLRLEERLRLPGMAAFRAELMGISALLVQHLLEMHPFQHFILSRYALKEGVYFSRWAAYRVL
ncbi:hypothetical protein GC167_07085 [bacterium]|nr:hypothetical protein [bacterium]